MYILEIRGVTIDDFYTAINKIKEAGYKVTQVGENMCRIHNTLKTNPRRDSYGGWELLSKIKHIVNDDRFDCYGVFKSHITFAWPASVREDLRYLKEQNND